MGTLDNKEVCLHVFWGQEGGWYIPFFNGILLKRLHDLHSCTICIYVCMYLFALVQAFATYVGKPMRITQS
jgi:hypothetical protein